MSTLKYAILGLLNRQSMTGYDLMKEFESSLKEFWHANHSQIYPELKKLTAENLIEFNVEITGKVLEKKCYRITDAGRKDFLNWLSSETEFEHTPKNIFRLKVFFSNNLDTDLRLEQLASHLKKHQDRLAYLKNNKKKFTDIPDKTSPEFGDYLVLTGAIMREESSCKWLEECINLTK